MNVISLAEYKNKKQAHTNTHIHTYIDLDKPHYQRGQPKEKLELNRWLPLMVVLNLVNKAFRVYEKYQLPEEIRRNKVARR